MDSVTKMILWLRSRRRGSSSWLGCSQRVMAFFCIAGLAFVCSFQPALPTVSRVSLRTHTPRLDHLLRGTDYMADDLIINDALSYAAEDHPPGISHFTVDNTWEHPSKPQRKASFISQIRSHRLAGFVNDIDDEDIVISLSGDYPFVVVTGESASGKSLFLVRALELLTGTSSAAAKSYVIPPSSHDEEDQISSTAFVEVQVHLVDPHGSALEAVLRDELPIRDTTQRGTNPEGKFFTFRRTLQWVPTMATSQQSTSSKNKYRFQSSCSINGHTMATQKDFFALTRPLFALVDATIAVNQILSSAGGLRRTQILDAAVSRNALRQLQQRKRHFQSCRRRRRQYEQELQQQTSNKYLSGDTSDEQQDRQLQLLSHYIVELDGFESRVTQFCHSILTSPVASVLDDENMSSSILDLGVHLSKTSWNQDSNAEAAASKKGRSSVTSSSFVSKMFVLLLEFRNAVQTLEDQQRMAQDIVNALSSSLPSSNSAIASLERARKLLIDIVDNDESNEALQSSTEHVHELLNQIEDRIRNCRQFVETNEEYGLLPIIQNTRDALAPQVTVQHIDSLLQEWKSLSRKHNVSPYMLPWCHASYQRERDGTSILAMELLPRARDNERIAAKAFQQAYDQVKRERQQVAQYLSKSLTYQYLPDLGLFPMKNQTVFAVETTSPPSDISDNEDDLPPPTDDTTDFILVSHAENQTAHSRLRVHEVASAGERARILLALECALPGAIGAALRSRESISPLDGRDDADLEEKEKNDDAAWYKYSSLPPIAIVYDEIDSHVGGRAVQSVTRCLLQQSRQGFQIMSITHSPTVAAAAQTHIIVQRSTATDRGHTASFTERTSANGIVSKQSTSLEGTTTSSKQPMVNICTLDVSNNVHEERRIQELVRMVGGDHHAANYLEAMTFAKSLIRNNQALFLNSSSASG
jgi:DNA repair ATPase RecN